jgi:hypothetical protein
MLIGGWMARKANWYALIPLFAAFSRYDAVKWFWKLTPLLCGVWLQHQQASSFPAHVLTLIVTVIVWRIHRQWHPHGRSGAIANIAFWSFALVITFQGYLLAVESVKNPSSIPRFTVAFSFVLLSILVFVLVVVYFLLLSVRAIWRGPSASQQIAGKRSLVKTALTTSIWVEDFVKYARRQDLHVMGRELDADLSLTVGDSGVDSDRKPEELPA